MRGELSPADYCALSFHLLVTYEYFPVLLFRVADMMTADDCRRIAAPPAAIAPNDILVRIGAICDDFECYGYRRVGADGLDLETTAQLRARVAFTSA